MELLLVVQSKRQTGKFSSGKVCQGSLGPAHLDFTRQSNASWTFSSWFCRCQPDCQLQITLCPNGLHGQRGATEPSTRQKPSLCRIKPITGCRKQVVPRHMRGDEVQLISTTNWCLQCSHKQHFRGSNNNNKNIK